MAFELPKLPYALDALAPHISKQTLEFHYEKHHQTYVDNLNKLIVGTEFEKSTLDEIVIKSIGGIFNNAAQVWNHTFYWNCLSPTGGGIPSGKTAEVINKNFGSFEEFKEKFTTASTSLFGSGWAWLVQTPDGKLEIIQESNAGNPMKNNKAPILTCDIWEHAYYLDKQNKRADYVASFWNLVDWTAVEKRLK